MKKYKTIDFIKLYTPNRKNVKIVYILVALIMVIGVYKVNMNQKRNTKIYNEETVLDENIDITESDEESIYINFDNIKGVFYYYNGKKISKNDLLLIVALKEKCEFSLVTEDFNLSYIAKELLGENRVLNIKDILM